MGVITDKLGADLKQQKDIHTFLKNNQEKFLNITLSAYLDELLSQKALVKANVIKKSGLPVTYAYKIFSGQKHTARNRILALAIAMQLNIDETNHLLNHAEHSSLYARNPWDAIIMYALEKHLSVIETNILLTDAKASPLLE
ncbi:XRE family transcriptional regulator [uncultured Megamonas sp.]|uniref:XRE family transcriptional regulator n=1 Tax=uncultured Megamonas sp. TaxID=286140 RepID=UPI0025E67E43|nr:XRE family transcriptional regulator [uncultured Megamonas sp.]